MNKGQKIASDLKYFSSYSQFQEDKGKKENWKESVDRVMRMHKIKFNDLYENNEEFKELVDFTQDMYEKKYFIGSQRALQWAIDPIFKHNSRMFNCLVLYADKPSFFQETMYWLLSGCGVGFSVQKRHIKTMPKLEKRTQGVKTFVISDDIEGWSDSIGVLISSFLENGGTFPEYKGHRIDFDYSLIRPKGAKISGGFKAPGPEGLRQAHLKIEHMLEEYLKNTETPAEFKSILIYDVVMHSADAVLSGGVRRSATISLFSKDDEEMLNAKTGNWFITNPQRGRSNNSVVLIKDKTTREEFSNIMNSVKQFGEPGFIWSEDEDILYNPCLSGDTIVETNNGNITMKQLVDMNKDELKKIKVPTYNESTQLIEYKNIEKAFLTKKNAKLIKITFDDNTFLRCTPNHEIFTSNRGWIKAKNLLIDDFILSRTEPNNYMDSILHMKEVPVDDDGNKPWNKDRLLVKEYVSENLFNCFNEYKKIKNNGTKSKKEISNKIFNTESIIELKKLYEENEYGLKVLSNHFDISYMKLRVLFKNLNIPIRTGFNVVTNTVKHFRKKRILGTKNPWSYIDSTNHSSISGYYKKKDGSYVYLRSSYEYAFALYLDSLNKKWNVEKEILTKEIDGVTYSYRPDFFVYDKNENIENIYEIKSNYILNGNNEKIKYFPEVTIIKDPFNLINRSYNSILEEWKKVCRNKIKSIKSIEKDGVEDVYDLTITDNHNFFANGTLVHNCVEIGMVPKYLVETQEDADELGVKVGEWVTGAQGCNLTEINGGLIKTKEEFLDACKASAIMGTLQASYTDFGYVNKVSKKIFDKEALLGCSITGWMNNPDILFDEEILKEGVEVIRKYNEIVAKIININPSARLTCTKPSGNASVLLGCASGIHGEHAPMYFRNMQFNKTEDIAEYMRIYNPDMVEESVWSSNKTDWVISIPIETNKNAIFKDQLYGVKQLEYVKKAQQYWVETGTNVERCTIPSTRHNISNTISVDNWEEVEQYIWDNRKHFAGISLLSMTGDRDYAQAPFTTVYSTKDIVKMYGDASLYASGLIVDALDAFNNNLWSACDTVLGYGEKLKYTKEEIIEEMESKSIEELWRALESRPKILKALIKSGEKPDLIDYKEYKDRKLVSNMFKATEKIDWVRRANQFADRFFGGDVKKMTYCLKDVYNNHKWNKIQRNMVEMEWEKFDLKPSYIDVDETGAIACSGASCEIPT